MKLLTITVPCYNAQDDMTTCLDSLLPAHEDVEILIVDDGSTDKTGAIADDYASRYPDTVRVIHHSENGGHGDAINTGILAATGLYFKVVDADDWVDPTSYAEVLHTLQNLCNAGCMLDLMLTNFVYEREGAKSKVMRYTHQLPVRQLFDWSQTHKLSVGKYILMHAVLYRTQLLRDCHLALPRHTYYVDNLFVYLPLPEVELMYYLDVDLYHYRLDRGDQSVNEQMMIDHIDQQLLVNRIMINSCDLRKIANLALRHYMMNYLEFVTIISTTMLLRSGTKENQDKKRELWTYLKEKDLRLFHYLRRRINRQTMHLPGRRGHGVGLGSYHISQKVIDFR